MPDNNVYGVDFIARCMAGEALDKAGQKAWTLVAGNNISILSDEEEKTETISAEIEVDDALSSTSTNPVENRVIYDALQNVEIDVDNALSTTSENPVQNKVITAALKTKPTSVLPDGTVINDQKIMALTRAQYDAIQNKDPNTYYMITDDPVPSTTPILRTAYVPLTSSDYTTGFDGTNRYLINFDAPETFEMLEVRISYRVTLTCGWYQNATLSFTDVLSIPSSASDTPREGRKLYTEMMKDEYIGEEPDITHIFKTITLLMGSNFIRYNSTTGKIQLEIGNFTAGYSNYVEGYPENFDVAVISNVEILDLGYVAYGSDEYITYDGLQAGTGIDITNDVISVDMPVGSEIGLTIDPATYELTATLYDQNTVPLSTATVDLPLESMVVSGTYDDTTKSVILTLQNSQTISFSVSDLVSGLETSAHAAATYQTIAGMSNYVTASDLSDRTYYCTCNTSTFTSSKVVTTTQDFKLEKGAIIAVKFDNQNGEGVNYVTLNVNNTGAKSIAVDATVPYTGDNPDICGYGGGYLNYYMYDGTYWHSMGCSRPVNGVPLPDASINGQVLTVVNGDAQWARVPTPTDMATQTWVGQQGYLTSADEVPAVGSSDDGKVLTASYSGGTGSYAWATPAAGGLSVETDGTNYWITVNGIRLYFASSAPTGNIPNGSLGIGW